VALNKIWMIWIFIPENAPINKLTAFTALKNIPQALCPAINKFVPIDQDPFSSLFKFQQLPHWKTVHLHLYKQIQRTPNHRIQIFCFPLLPLFQVFSEIFIQVPLFFLELLELVFSEVGNKFPITLTFDNHLM
jgi:hypothetical protein